MQPGISTAASCRSGRLRTDGRQREPALLDPRSRSSLHGHWRAAMRTIPITAAALVLLSTAASAQMSPSRDNSTSPAPRTSSSGPATTAPVQRSAAVNPLTQEDVSKIEGTGVYGGDDGKIG